MNAASQSVASLIVALLVSVPANAQEARRLLTAKEAASLPVVKAEAGTSGVTGIETRLLLGDPTQAGVYTISIRVPPNTHIAAHSHRDDRTAVVVSGVWHFGYGQVADDAAAQILPAGSYYTEPANDAHFAWTGAEGATVYISGIGPSSTTFTAR